ncbi:unnamed protein product [Fusarium graminearum]|uniref:Chromosome 3, complete genome n=1 Tax=Gibberella zeae (strain ATCC MYA-4620 / CBS 123657 / FGSC 9075 / NRRL 31084 / PH-1) TaxID=229533 RepID=I1S7P3_GIBZE|nr:hypothetical protein FGSG_12868 [Fusarium graminearum PH-1]ESU12173.1 hypothetical protein FGSG_12868 [Fusarium graminearum PH-1]CEF88200.1 unnamed protein product [Fusarium graminearum]CZS84868.1 unnamed protein product [Fusarium graminearum]|eukprot:XP_011324749.1 hypothetical protein FGSG_12868 [Fusarium graminearum PH-1]
MPLGRLHISNRGSFVSHHRRAGKDSYIHQALRFVSTPLAWFYIQLGQASKCGWMLAKISCVRQRDFSYSTTSTHRKGWIRRLATSKSGTGFRGQTERVKHGMMTGAMRAEKGTSSGTNSLGLNVDPLAAADAHLFLSIFSYSHVREAIVSPPFDIFTSIKLVMEPESFLKNTKNNTMLVLCTRHEGLLWHTKSLDNNFVRLPLHPQ